MNFLLPARIKAGTEQTPFGPTLGIIIGVSAVWRSARRAATHDRAFANIGANMVWVEAGGMNKNGVRTGNGQTSTLTLGDYEAIKTRIPLVTNVTPQADTGVQLIYGNQNWHSSVRGIGPAYIELKNWKVARGGMFTDQDVDRASNVCVLGQTIVDQLFGDEQDPLGEIIRVNNEPCKVLGVLEVKGQSATGQDQDDNLLMPYSTVMKKIKGQTWLDDIMCSALSGSQIDQAEQDITTLMRERHHIRPDGQDDFNLRHPTEIAEAVKASTQTMETLLAAIASVSLLVGGVGIMNIMLVSVTERTREIGLRMAVGARAADVLRQFLIEAVLLSVLGGAVGVAIGLFGARAIANSLHWPTHISTSAIWIAFGVSAAIGITFGYYPAFRAARLDPIEALRIE
jgi:putative ABC transport system permease protein